MSENNKDGSHASLESIAASTSHLLSELDDSRENHPIRDVGSETGEQGVKFSLPKLPRPKKHRLAFYSISFIALLATSAPLVFFIFTKLKESRQFALADAYAERARVILARGLPLVDDSKTHINAYIEAFEAASKSIEAYSINSEAYALRARARSGLGQYTEAVADADKAISIDSASWNAFFARANAKGQLGDKKGQMEDLNKAIAINPGFAGAYLNRASLKKSTGDREGALSDLSSALGLSSINKFEPLRVASIISDRADLYFRMNRLKESCSDHKRAIDLYRKGDETKYKQSMAWLNSDGGAWCRAMN